MPALFIFPFLMMAIEAFLLGKGAVRDACARRPALAWHVWGAPSRAAAGPRVLAALRAAPGPPAFFP